MARKESKNGETTVEKTIEGGEEILSFKSEKPLEMEKEQPKADSRDIEIVKLGEEMDRMRNAQMRLQADFENYKKRNVEQGRKSFVEGSVDIVTAFLPLLDTFDRAISILPADDKSGIFAIKKQLDNILASLNITEIEAEGKDFDPTYHNAVMQVEDAENSDKVVEVLQKGYMFKERIVRHSMVKVAK